MFLHNVKSTLKWYVKKAAETYAWSPYFKGYDKQ